MMGLLLCELGRDWTVDGAGADWNEVKQMMQHAGVDQKWLRLDNRLSLTIYISFIDQLIH